MLTRRLLMVLCAAVAAVLLIPGAAQATGVFSSDGTTLTFNASPGDTDNIAGFETATSVRFTRFGGADIGPADQCQFVGNGTGQTDSDTVDCPKGSLQRVVLNLGDGDDVADVSALLTLPVIIDGGSGNDGLFGGGGFDNFFGGSGNDNIVARDGKPETINCGDGNDTAISDDSDTRISCEQVEGDADGDGVRRPADCDDTNPLIHPGVFDVPDDGIDQDCSGTDAVNLDRDGDGFPRPQDCNDTDRAIHPGAKEIKGNAVDENCDTVVEPYPPLSGSVSGTWTKVGKRTRNLTLVAKGLPTGTQVTMRCARSSNCPSKVTRRQIQRDGQVLNLHSTLGRRALRTGARIELSLTRTGNVGRLLRYRLKAPGTPEVSFLCAPPGQKAGPC